MAHLQHGNHSGSDGVVLNESVLSETSYTQISLLDDFHTRSPSPANKPRQQQQQKHQQQHEGIHDGNDIDDKNSVDQDLLQTSFSDWITTSSPVPMEQQQTPSPIPTNNDAAASAPDLYQQKGKGQLLFDDSMPSIDGLHLNELSTTLSSLPVTTTKQPHTGGQRTGTPTIIDTSHMATPVAKPVTTSGPTSSGPASGSSSASMNRRSTTLALKDQEKAIDTFRKDNFGLKMKIFYLEKRLEELSPDQNDLAIRENIDLKVKIQTLGHELKKYKNMILELNQAMAMVQQQQQQCTRPHGMSEEEQLEYENALTSADAFRLENDQLQKLVSEQRMENARLRLVCSQRLAANNNNHVVKSLSSSSTSSSSSSSSSQQQQSSSASTHSSNNNNNKDLLERYKKSWAQAKQTVQEQNETIVRLKDTIQHYQTTTASASASALERRDWIDMEQGLKQTRERNRDLQSQVRHATNELEEWKHRTVETKKALEQKCVAYDELLLQMDHDHRHRQEDDDQRRQRLENQRDEAQQLHETTQQLLDQREHDLELLEEEMEKVVRHAEELEKQLEDKDQSWENETARLRQWYSEQQDELSTHWRDREAQLAAAHTQAEHDAKKRYDDDLQLLEVKFIQVEQSIRERDVRIASLEGHLDAQTDAAQREKQLGQEEIKDLEDQLTDALTTVQHQKQQLDLYLQSVSPNTPIESSQDLEAQIQSLQIHLKEAEDRLKRDRYAANQALNDAMKSQQLLQQTLDTVRKRNELLTSLLDQCQNPESKISGKRLDKATRLLTKLNQELHHELEDRDRQLETERSRAQQLDELYAQSLEELEDAQQLLIRRDNMITRALERIESDKEKKEVLENVLRRQATEDLDIVLQNSMDSLAS